MLSTVILMASCNVGPQPIEFGEDGCHYCTMTIVDRLHASELVTSKGKVYKFDAIECMINYMKDHANTAYKHAVISDFNEPGVLVDAKNATYLISKEISSPMGAYLSGFEKNEAAKKTQAEYGGTLFSWNELFEHLNK